LQYFFLILPSATTIYFYKYDLWKRLAQKLLYGSFWAFFLLKVSLNYAFFNILNRFKALFIN